MSTQSHMRMKAKSHAKKMVFLALGLLGLTKVQEKSDPPLGSLQRLIYSPILSNLILPFAGSKLAANLISYGLSNNRMSKPLIKKIIKDYNVDMNDFQISDPEKYKNFNDFFTRELKPGARIVDQRPESIVAPTDANLFIVENISKANCFFVKSKEFKLETFLQSKKLAKEFENGTLVIFRLSPEHYHHYHFPTDCLASYGLPIEGTLGAVNKIAYEFSKNPLSENKRRLIVLKSEDKEKNCLMITVGAMFIGRMTETFDPSIKQKKGDKCGFFQFGGSTVVLLFKKDAISICEPFQNNSKKDQETSVKMGEAFALWNRAKK
jgi:phosphatidylserine decarboxylase